MNAAWQAAYEERGFGVIAAQTRLQRGHEINGFDLLEAGQNWQAFLPTKYLKTWRVVEESTRGEWRSQYAPSHPELNPAYAHFYRIR